MPLLDHFHPPLHGPRRWEGFHHTWAAVIAQQLNRDILPPAYFAEPGASIRNADTGATGIWSSPRPQFTAKADFARRDAYEVRVYQDVGGAELRAVVELVSPANKDRPGSRNMFAGKCAGYLKRGIGVVVVDIVTAPTANLHKELFDMLGASGLPAAWQSPTALYVVAYHAVTSSTDPRVDVWSEPLIVGKSLPVMPLWLGLDLCVPVRLEESYLATCESLRISA